MDEADREEIRQAHRDNATIASVAVMGVVALCNEMAIAGVIGRAQIERISDFMLASVESSDATATLQAHLHEAIGKQFSDLYAQLPPDV